MHVVRPASLSTFERPTSAGATHPASLRMPSIAFPGPTDAGRTLAKLGEPPAADSTAQARDLKVSHALIAQRSAEGDAWARALDAHGGTKVWHELAARVAASGVAGDAPVEALVGAALRAASMQAAVGKRTWSRQRPFQVDPTITVVGRTPKAADTSYPSGHTARAFAAARIISALDPKLATDAYALAAEVAYSRIYAGVHFASDVLAGARLGTSLADSVLTRWRAGKLAGVAPFAA